MAENTEVLNCEKCAEVEHKVTPATWTLTHRPCGHVKAYCTRHKAFISHAFENVDYIVCGEHIPYLRCTSIRWDKLAAVTP